MKRFLSLFLCVCMMLPLAACGQPEKQTAETTATPQTTAPDSAADTGTAVPAETEPYYEPDSLPQDLSFDGESAHVYGWTGYYLTEFYAEEESGEVVNDAIFSRNRNVEERLDVVLSFTLTPGSYFDRTTWFREVQKSTMAGDGQNDIVGGYNHSAANLAYYRLLQDLNSLEYLDFDKPWWPQSLLDAATCGGKLYFCSGDISLNLIGYLYAVFFNKKIAQSYDGDLYELVRNGEWTLDRMTEIADSFYVDLNGDGEKNRGDQFGFVTNSVYSDALFFSSGLRTTEHDEDGFPVLSAMFGGDKTQALLEKLVNAFQTKAMYLEIDGGVNGIFTEEQTLFYLAEVCHANVHMRDVEFEYGILPAPKYDTEQEEYYTVASFPYTLYGVPIDALHPEMSGAILECMASESYRLVSPAYFETSLKVKYASDPDASEMYDIIRGSAVFDFGRIFNDSMQGLTYSLFRNNLARGNTNWISAYKAQSRPMERMLDKIVQSLIKEME